MKTMQIASLKLAPQELGIENIKAALAIVLEIGILAVDLLKDFSWNKLAALGFKIAGISNILPLLQQAWLEFKDLKADESAEVTEFLKTEFDIENDDLEFRIEQGFELLQQTHAIGTQVIPLAGSWIDWARSWKKAS